ncbi:hypothetical protein B0H14DRAFT_3598969 [Mycena olivaceomarginata]|nr:hypothetical protein B0H14DRAFT_3598969 [Mycena olivaceomarginata]
MLSSTSNPQIGNSDLRRNAKTSSVGDRNSLASIRRSRRLYAIGHYTCLLEWNAAIEACEEVLKLAKTNCARNYSELTDGTRRFLEAKLSVSKIQIQLLETRSVTTWEEFMEYLHDVRETMRNISQCAKESEGSSQIYPWLTIEAERQRQLSEESRKFVRSTRTVICSPAAARPTTRPATRHFELAVIRNTSYDISM